ncbi:MAG TPA: PEP-CTERM sorting domain-containing protein [Pseudolabrys sp.]|nr:PEP-CTERM sorting domain-containing protein [Pseudolabrys sp.]
MATTTRDQWSAVATNIGVDGTAPCLVAVDGTCYFYGAPIYAAYEPQFSYAGSGNYILPGESDGSFFWELSSPPDPTYVIHLTNIDTNVQGVCTGNILTTTGASTSSTCSPPGSPTAVPEPSSGLLFATALLSLMCLRRKRAPCLAHSAVQG